MPAFEFRPKLLDSLQGYSRQLFIKDVGAGLLVSVLGGNRVQIGGTADAFRQFALPKLSKKHL